MRAQQNILVTGGAGYVGSHVCKALHLQGYTPVVFDNLSTGHHDFVKWGPFHKGDITNPEDLDAAFQRYKPEYVLHLAANAYVRESIFDPLKYYVNNCIGSIRLLEAMQRHNINKIIVASTCAVYSPDQPLPLLEDTVKNPTSPYGKSKLFLEEALKDLEISSGLNWVSLRFFNAAGADPDSEIGEQHEPETHIIPLTIKAALGTAPQLQVFGNTFNTKDGTAVRDYVHVNDLAAAHLKAMDYIAQGGAPGAFNIGTGTGTSIAQIIKSVEKQTGRKVPYTLTTPQAGDTAALYACSERAQTQLGWRPQFSTIDTIVKTALNWHKKTISDPAPSSRIDILPRDRHVVVQPV